MSKTVQTFELSLSEQDTLWIHNRCPKCGSMILDITSTVDYVEFGCSRCDILYYCE